jgi:hypothetical protein
VQKTIAIAALPRFLDAIADREVLLVLDDAGNACAHYLLCEVLRLSHRTRVIVTSATPPRLAADSGHACGLVAVRPLSVHACVELIERMCPWMLGRDAQSIDRVLALIRESGHNPHTIRVRLEDEAARFVLQA